MQGLVTGISLHAHPRPKVCQHSFSLLLWRASPRKWVCEPWYARACPLDYHILVSEGRILTQRDPAAFVGPALGSTDDMVLSGNRDGVITSRERLTACWCQHAMSQLSAVLPEGLRRLCGHKCPPTHEFISTQSVDGPVLTTVAVKDTSKVRDARLNTVRPSSEADATPRSAFAAGLGRKLLAIELNKGSGFHALCCSYITWPPKCH